MRLASAADDPSTKAGVGIAGILCAKYATVGKSAAVEARHVSGQGQRINLALMDARVAARGLGPGPAGWRQLLADGVIEGKLDG